MFFTSWSYFTEFLLRFKMLFIKKLDCVSRYDQSKSGRIIDPYGKGKLKWQKWLFHLKSISSFIFQAIFFKLSQSNLYTITKNFMLDLKKKLGISTFFWRKKMLLNFCHKFYFFKLLKFINIFFLTWGTFL